MKGENQKSTCKCFCSLDPQFKENKTHTHNPLYTITKGFCLQVFHVECLSRVRCIKVPGLAAACQTNEVCINELPPLLQRSLDGGATEEQEIIKMG